MIGVANVIRRCTLTTLFRRDELHEYSLRIRLSKNILDGFRGGDSRDLQKEWIFFQMSSTYSGTLLRPNKLFHITLPNAPFLAQQLRYNSRIKKNPILELTRVTQPCCFIARRPNRVRPGHIVVYEFSNSDCVTDARGSINNQNGCTKS